MITTAKHLADCCCHHASCRQPLQEFAGLGRSFVTMLSWVAGDPNLTLLYRGVAHPLAACVIGAGYIVCFTLILMTLLVGAVGGRTAG